MQPSEFWRLPVCDFWAELDAKVDEARKMQEMTEDFKAGKGGKGNVFSRAEWDAARKKHREKMGK